MTNPLPDQINRPDFGISVRGYDRQQVDAYFGRVVEWLADAENRAAAAERARGSLTREVTELRTAVAMLEERTGLRAPQSMSAFSERMEQVMASALQAAQDLRAEAEQEASKWRESAREEAERLIATARDDAERVVHDARLVQQAMEENIDRLRASRSEAVDALLELQQQIAAIVGEPEPSVDAAAKDEVDAAAKDEVDAAAKDEVDAAAKDEVDAPAKDADDDVGNDRGDVHVEDDITVVVPAVLSEFPEGRSDAADDSTSGVHVTATPTLVQPAVQHGVDGDLRAGRRRRSA